MPSRNVRKLPFRGLKTIIIVSLKTELVTNEFRLASGLLRPVTKPRVPGSDGRSANFRIADYT